MTPEDFSRGFYQEKKSLLDLYFNSKESTDVTQLISELNLDKKGNERLRQIINGVLRDGFYSILWGLDGTSQIGLNQEAYKLLDEKGNEITGGEIESCAWEYFHNNKFEADKNKADFIAELEYKLEGGRKNPVQSGYRCQIKFEFDKMHTSGLQEFINRDYVFPGDKVNAEINILSVDHFANRLKEGMKFELCEGEAVIGNGKILILINNKLKIAANT